VWRGYATRKEYLSKRSQLDSLQSSLSTDQDLTAISIQKAWLGYSARRGYLSNPSYVIYKQQCEAASLKGHNMPMANLGNTPVFFPPATPSIILKRSGRTSAIQRFKDMQTVRGILRSQGSSHLEIPRAALCGDFLIEDRLSISSDRFVNMQRYIEHPQAFDEAIHEMTCLFSKACLTDLVASQIHPISNIVGDTIRYDNIPLYIENGVGKIGLIDLEHIYYQPFTSYFNRWTTYQSPPEILARIFPYHVDMIIEQSKQLNMQFNEDRVRCFAKDGLEFLQKGYIDHLNWLRQKEITPQNFNQVFEVTPDRIEMIIQNLTQKISRKNVSCLTPEIINSSVQDIISDIEKVLLDTKTLESPSAVNTDAALIAFRSPTFKRDRLESSVREHFKTLDNYDQLSDFIDDLVEGTCAELTKGRELFAYDPNYTSDAHKLCWIRY
jgi:hypothetical protein